MSRDKPARTIFPTFLLPSLKIPFRGSRPIDLSLSRKPVAEDPVRLTRSQSDTLRCKTCSADLAFATQIISKGFTGRHGRAYLVAPPAAAAESARASSRSDRDIVNVSVGRCESRQLVTGWHTVADITCVICGTKLGWKYVDAKESSQHYKVGKFILETERVVTYRSWEDSPVSPVSSVPAEDNGAGVAGGDREGSEVVEFDSGDEDECDDIFSGTWDRESVAMRRRSKRLSSRGS
ncbi:related to yippee family protein [Cephalotrichum gorgonifer]|uniref:Related to yippee family protein n=1 Tax=Cephalotrichum gorgonifer TaxID=2041049 RepID=A0AAE8SR56_9PEZI|nr:related to yippee family protein [Cephalotrichum gorgonifer]